MKKDILLHTIAKLIVRLKGTTSSLQALRTMLLLLVMMMGTATAWGQTGIWYIANDNTSNGHPGKVYSSASDTEKYYLVPAKDPQQQNAIDAYYSPNHNTTNGDQEKPFLATALTNKDLNSIWIVTESGESDYYFIIHALTGKYVIYEVPLPNDPNKNTDSDETKNGKRKTMHLQTIDNGDYNPSANENFKFAITSSGSGYNIRPKSRTGWYWNPAGQNNNVYYGQTSGENPNLYRNGLVGVYNNTGTNSIWHFEDASLATALTPVISDVDGSTNTFTITSPAAAFSSIRYTIDGSTTPDASTGNTVASGSPITITSTWNVQAVGVFSTTFVTPVAGPKELSPLAAPPTISYNNATGLVTISSAAAMSYYYTTNGDTPSTSTGTLYETPFPVTTATTVKAIAIYAGGIASEPATLEITQVATPTIQNNGSNAITITTTTPSATIYYTTDGSTPTTTSTLYTRPLTENVSSVTIKAIAVKEGMITSAVGSGAVTFQCATPIIKRGNNNTFTLECGFPAEGVTIYYTTDGASPTTSSSVYTSPVNTSFPVTVKAIAVAEGYDNSAVAEKTINEGLESEDGYYLIASAGDFNIFISMVNSDGANEHFKVTDGFTVSNPPAISNDFSGIFDGGYHTISGLSHSLFNTVNGGTVKNVVLSGVDISATGNAGAICNVASGATKIYNCGVLSGSVSGTSNVGGLVGLINSGSSVRVVNCYNYANVSGGSTMAGIVGKNEGTVGNVRIALCMMYGNMPNGTSPVYAGNHISNVSNFTEYNYYRSKANLTYTAYNDQLAIDKDEYLARFPFYRHILNTHRELAAYFLFGDYAENHVSEIGHWVLKKGDSAPKYPIVEAWETNTTKTLTAANAVTDVLTDMGGSGYLNVSIKIGSNSYLASLPITAMDEANYDYVWGKVVLPFANEFEVNTDYTHVCTGWKITGITGGTSGTFENYNVSDRNCTVKDLYSTTGFIFAQGGNYVVPYGVTAISIEANFATAYYLSDEAYEIGYSGDKTGKDASGYSGRTALGGSMSDSYQGQTVYHTLAGALAAMSSSGSTHEQAVVLVGNYHQDSEDLTSHTSKGLTIMSIDADNNQEPDYAWYSNNTQDRPAIPPTRFDFMALIPMGISSRVNNSTFYPVIPIWKPRGWFEMTETCLSTMEQFELESGNFDTSESDTKNYRCIINGGYFTQMVRSRRNACSKVKYYQIGGNAYIKEFYPGNHSANNYANTLVPINVTGGEIEQCFMTGYGKGTAVGSNIYFWCAGGKIGKFLGAYMEKPRQTSNSDGNVNMTAKIDHALIGRFFGGGTTPKAQITGNIDVTINNSKVDFYCGGPEFGDMVTGTNGKTVTTRAKGTTFGEYYGAGYGGTAITYTNDEDDNNQGLGSNTKPTVTYPSGFFTSHFVDQRLVHKDGYGIGSCYKFEFIFNSRGSGSVARFYTGYAQFSLATTGSVTNELTNCKVMKLSATETVLGKEASSGDFYGAGCQGKVSGTVTSTLTGCTVEGCAYGGGYKAESNEVNVYPETPPTMSVYTRETGIFSDFGKVNPVIFEWKQSDEEHLAGSSVDANAQGKGGILYTDVTLSELGNVTGAISLTIDGNSKIGYDEDGNRNAQENSGNVFGGGNESKSLNNTTVILKGNAEVGGSVFGGGNKANVDGNTTVTIVD